MDSFPQATPLTSNRAPMHTGPSDFVSVGAPITTPLWLRKRVRALILQADAAGSDVRALVDLGHQRRPEMDIAKRDVDKLKRELEQAKRGVLRDYTEGRETTFARPKDQAEVERIERALKIAQERFALIDADEKQRQAELDVRMRIRTQAQKVLAAIASAMPGGATLIDQTRGRQ